MLAIFLQHTKTDKTYRSKQTGSKCTNGVVDKIVAKPRRSGKPVARVDGGLRPVKNPKEVGTSHPPTAVTTSFHSGGSGHRR